MAADKTERKHSGLVPFQPGQSGNPAGRPLGARNKLGEAFLEALCADFQEHGVAAIQTVRAEKPDQYLKVIASILPKEFHVKDLSLDDMSDAELIAALAAARAVIAGSLANGVGNGKQASPKTNGSGKPH